MNFIRKKNISLARFTTVRIGGVAQEIFFPLNQEGIKEVFSEIKETSFFILGGGSNVVIQDAKLDYSVIMTSHLTHYRFDRNYLTVQAGVLSSLISELAANKNLAGLEYCYGLPGSVGGAVFMNARAYGSEMADLVEDVLVYNYETNEFLKVSNKECNFAYKSSLFQDKPYLIYEIKMKLQLEKSNKEIKKRMEKYKFERKEKGHYNYPSAGCTFKNNYQLGIPAGKVIDELGLKGFKIGGLKISDKHANFIENDGGGTYIDYVNMVNEIQEKVKNKKGINLECEVRFLP